MKVHEQRDRLVEAMELAISNAPQGPGLSAFGIAREDCALAHIDYFGLVGSVKGILSTALGEVRGQSAAEVLQELKVPPFECDCRHCVGEEAAAEARARHRAAYDKVAAWKPCGLSTPKEET